MVIVYFWVDAHLVKSSFIGRSFSSNSLKILAYSILSKPTDYSDLESKISTLSEEYANKIFDKIQLEAGKYEINLQITYGSISGLGAYFSRCTKPSKLTFEIEGNARDQIKLALPAAVRMIAINNITNTSLFIHYPQYAPINKHEDSAVC